MKLGPVQFELFGALPFVTYATGLQLAEEKPETPKAKKCKPRKLAAADSTGQAGFEHFIRKFDIPYVAVDEAKKAIYSGAAIKSFNFLVYRQDGPNHLVVVVHGRPTVEQDTLLAEWEKTFGSAFVGVFVRRLGSGAWAFIVRGSGEPWVPYLPV